MMEICCTYHFINVTNLDSFGSEYISWTMVIDFWGKTSMVIDNCYLLV